MDQKSTITLQTPIKRGDNELVSIDVNKPNTGSLRGVNLFDLLQGNTDALIKVIPRVTTPALTEQEANRLDPADTLKFATEIVGFLVPTSAREESSPAE